jgi:hypothetical protein
VDHSSYLDSMITSNAKFTVTSNSGLPWQKAVFSKNKTFFFSPANWTYSYEQNSRDSTFGV